MIVLVAAYWVFEAVKVTSEFNKPNIIGFKSDYCGFFLESAYEIGNLFNIHLTKLFHLGYLIVDFRSFAKNWKSFKV